MSRKVDTIITTPDREKLEWRITPKKTDPTTGQVVSDGNKQKTAPQPQSESPLGKLLERASGVDVKGLPPKVEPKPAESVERTTAKETQQTRYQDAKAAGQELKAKLSGETAKPAGTLERGAMERLSQDKLGTSAQRQQSLSQATVTSQGVASKPSASGEKRNNENRTPERSSSGERGTAKRSSPDEHDVVRSSHHETFARRANLKRSPLGEHETPQAQQGATANALQAGVAQAGNKIKENTQLSEKTADNNDEEVSEKKDGESAQSTSPWGHARSAGKELRYINAGLGGGGGGDTDNERGFESTANRIDIDKSAESKKLGIEIYNDDEKTIGPKLAAIEFGKDVEKLLKHYITLDEQIDKWKPEQGIVDRIVADTKLDIAAAQELLKAMRTRGKNSPNGYGMAA